ncbi:MAG: lysylphosphatidylglycerol synthase transmembrane domain-containing protein [Polaribacter sp.]|uniref:lysylphosphatidylglycerol synthase transmembrane domain-containing protein n=1 Tax=Polaribacter sp. TaxID=1920175 RepID=UPI003BB20A99
MDIKKVLKISIPLILGGFLVWYSLTIVSPEELAEYFKKANYSWIALGLLFGILSHLSRAYRWKYLLEPLGYKPRFVNATLAVLVAYLMNIFLPRAGEVTRAAVMTNYEKIPFEKGFGTIVAERLADLIMMFIIIGITLFIQFDFIWNLLLKDFNPKKTILSLVLVIVFFVVFILYFKKAKSKFALKVKSFFLGLKDGVTSIFKMKNKWAFIFHTVFIWVMYVAMFWATIPAVDGLEVPIGGILIGFIAGGLSIAATNGGVGLYPVAVASALALFGIDKVTGNAFGWIMWTAQTAMIIVFGGLAFLLLPVVNKTK